MNQDEIVRKIAEAAHVSGMTDARQLEAAITELKPSPEMMVQAYALCFSDGAFYSRTPTREILHARLQVMLMREHVKAQERIGATIKWLTWALVGLSVALVAFGGFDIWLRLRGGG